MDPPYMGVKGNPLQRWLASESVGLKRGLDGEQSPVAM
jgi:hypothetical protein